MTVRVHSSGNLAFLALPSASQPGGSVTITRSMATAMPPFGAV